MEGELNNDEVGVGSQSWTGFVLLLLLAPVRSFLLKTISFRLRNRKYREHDENVDGMVCYAYSNIVV